MVTSQTLKLAYEYNCLAYLALMESSKRLSISNPKLAIRLYRIACNHRATMRKTDAG